MTTPANPDDLITWLHQQFDDDERVALETPEESRSWTHRSFVDYSAPDLPQDDHTLWFGDRVVGEVGFGDGEILPDEAEHIARHDPARVLAEVDAKRRLLQQFELRGNSVRATVQPSTGGVWDDLLRMLALPYADRPGYREDWRP